MNTLTFEGIFRLDVVRRGIIVESREYKNGIVNEGKNDILDIFLGVQAKRSWYFGLIAPGGALLPEDTLASKSWTEVTDYTGDRKIYVAADPASDKEIESDVVIFAINDYSVTVNGSFLTSAETGVGILWSTGHFPDTLTLDTADEVRVSYILRVK